MIRTLGRTLLLTAVAAAALQSCARAAEEESSLGRIPEFQKKLNERITYENAGDTTLGKALDELLKQNGVPYLVKETAFAVAAPDNRDVIRSAPIGKIDKLEGMTRASVLKELLSKVPSDGGKTTPTYILRPDHLEITTRDALLGEVYPDWSNSNSNLANSEPPLTYAIFKETSFRNALNELALAARANVILDGHDASDVKVTAELNAVPFDAALRILANMHGLKVVRIANVYYITSPKNARQLQKEEDERILKLAAAGAM